MSEQNTSQLKLKYTLLSIILGSLCIVISAYPILALGQLLAELLEIPKNVPVNDQEYGWLWVGLLVSQAIAIFLLIYWFLSSCIAKYKKWTTALYINIFWKGKYPEHWYK